MNHRPFRHQKSTLFRSALIGLLVLVRPMNVLHAQDADSTRSTAEVYAQVGYHAMNLANMKGMVDGIAALLSYDYNISPQ